MGICIMGTGIYMQYKTNEALKIKKATDQSKSTILLPSLTGDEEKKSNQIPVIFSSSDNCGNIFLVEKQINQIGASFMKAVPLDENDAMQKQACFQKNFQTCKPALLTISNGGNEFQYEIIGKQNDQCAVKQTEIKSTQSSIAGKDMTCLYSATQTFSDFEQVYINDTCTGPLFDFLKAFKF